MTMQRYIDYMRLAEERFSCRAYSEKEPTAEQLSMLVEAARIAPSACNRQPWRLCVIEPSDREGRDIVVSAYDREWIRTAPAFIVVCGMATEAWVRPYDGHNHLDVDLSIATQQICLAATAMGLGTCWICNFDPASLSVGLNLPKGVVPMAIIPVGYPAEGLEPKAKVRKSTDEILLKR